MKRISILVGVLVFLFSLCFVSTLWSQTQSPPPSFVAQVNKVHNMQVVDLGAYPGGTNSWAADISNFDLVAGWSDMSGVSQQHPMMVPLIGPNHMQWMDLSTLGGEGDAGAEAISDTGLIVGHAITGSGDYHAFAWTYLTGMVDLGTLIYLGHTVSTAHAVNRSGTLIVGFSVNSDGSDMRPVVWTPWIGRKGDKLVITWTIHELSATDLGQYTNGGVNAVDNRGWIAGGAWGDAGWTGVVWKPVRGGKGWKPMQLFGTADYPIVSPQHLNDLGELVGIACKSDWSSCSAVLGEPTGGGDKSYAFTNLPNPLGPPMWDQAQSINNRGDIVGGLYDQSWNAYAAVWSTKNPSSVELVPALPGQLGSWLYGVNESGIAVGTYNTTDFQHAIGVQLKHGH